MAGRQAGAQAKHTGSGRLGCYSRCSWANTAVSLAGGVAKWGPHLLPPRLPPLKPLL